MGDVRLYSINLELNCALYIFSTYISVDRFSGSPVATQASALCHCLGSTEWAGWFTKRLWTGRWRHTFYYWLFVLVVNLVQTLTWLKVRKLLKYRYKVCYWQFVRFSFFSTDSMEWLLSSWFCVKLYLEGLCR
jgi:hypothetical protein